MREVQGSGINPLDLHAPLNECQNHCFHRRTSPQPFRQSAVPKMQLQLRRGPPRRRSMNSVYLFSYVTSEVLCFVDWSSPELEDTPRATSSFFTSSPCPFFSWKIAPWTPP